MEGQCRQDGEHAREFGWMDGDSYCMDSVSQDLWEFPCEH